MPYGISLRTGKKLFKVFQNFMKVRNNDFYMDLSIGTKHKSNIKLNEKVDLCNILGSMASKIKRELKEETIVGDVGAEHEME